MKIVSFEKKFEASLEEGWKILIDIEQYPRFVPFITNATLSGPLAVGTIWYDTTNILWVTQRVAHKVMVIEEYERLVFIVPVIGGEVREEFLLENMGKHTKITMTVSVSIRPRFVEETVGRILARRFKHMLSKTLGNIEAFLEQK